MIGMCTVYDLFIDYFVFLQKKMLTYVLRAYIKDIQNRNYALKIVSISQEVRN